MNDLDTRLKQGPLRVRSVWSAESPERLARRILQRRRLLFALDAVALCASIALVFFLSTHRTQRAPLLAQGPAGSVTPSPVLSFVDGSLATLSNGESKVLVEQDTTTRVVTRVSGGARFQVVPNAQRTFEVQARDVRVRVLGTVFSVQELPTGQTQVLVERGRVEVAWLGGTTILQTGQGGAFPPAAGSEPPATADSPEPPAIDPSASSAPSSASGSSGPSMGGGSGHAGARRSWRDYARNGDYAKAYDELNPRAGKPKDAVRDEVDDLLLAADVARLSAHPDQAISPLRGVCDRHATDKRAPVAAFTLGRVLLDELARPTEAAAAFHKARRLWPEGPLAEDALAREADAWDRAGRADRARALAGEYVARYPQGRHLAAIRKTLGP
jgi:transmembrane sensor